MDDDIRQVIVNVPSRSLMSHSLSEYLPVWQFDDEDDSLLLPQDEEMTLP